MLNFLIFTGYGEQNSALANRMAGNFPGSDPSTTPGSFGGGLTRNEGTIPGIGIAMPLSIPSLDTSAQGDQKPPVSASIPSGAPPLPPGPHPSLFAANQQQSYQQNAQQLQHHQLHQQQMTSLPLAPPNMPQLQHPSHLPMLQHPQLPRPPSQLPSHNMPSMPMRPMVLVTYLQLFYRKLLLFFCLQNLALSQENWKGLIIK